MKLLKTLEKIMQNLKRGNFFCFFVIFLLGCATSSYRIGNQDFNRVELCVTPDRVLLECEWIHDSDRKNVYGFMIHVLDEENTVLNVIQGNVLDKGSCFERIKKIGKILKEGKNIYIAGMGDLNDPRVKEENTYIFPQGIFYSNGRVLQFISITNEYGSCFDAYDGDREPCPGGGFPINNSSPCNQKENFQ